GSGMRPRSVLRCARKGTTLKPSHRATIRLRAARPTMPETPVFAVAAVAAPHALAAESGRAILAEGGNAIEAMIAMAATIAVVYPHMNHIGGDGFWLIREPSGRVRALMAAGRAGSKATPQLYREAGHDVVPARGPFAALTVPGAISGWRLALDAAKAHGG